MGELYRLMRLHGEPPWTAAWFVFMAVVTGSVPMAKYVYMEGRLSELDEKE